jgi:hypothetical protein
MHGVGLTVVSPEQEAGARINSRTDGKHRQQHDLFSKGESIDRLSRQTGIQPMSRNHFETDLSAQKQWRCPPFNWYLIRLKHE